MTDIHQCTLAVEVTNEQSTIDHPEPLVTGIPNFAQECEAESPLVPVVDAEFPIINKPKNPHLRFIWPP